MFYICRYFFFIRFITLSCLLFFVLFINAQTNTNIVKGTLIDYKTQKPLLGAKVFFIGTEHVQFTNIEGKFLLNNIPTGNQILKISLTDYETKNYPLELTENETITLGTIYLINDSTVLDEIGQIEWTENPFDNNSTYLSTSRDVFSKRVAYDFSQTFFSIRGYDATTTEMMINGINMNSLFDGRPQWKGWVGLNDITRHKMVTQGLSVSTTTFGNLLGTANINTRASEMRPGFRVSSSYSNKNYTGSAMATYNSGLQKNGLSYSISASRRWGNEGYVNATLYDAFSLLAAVEYNLNKKNSVNATAIYAPSRSGQTTAITERSFNEFGAKYNPYWGWQEGEKRNSSIKKFEMPIFILSHFYATENTSLTTSIGYQFGKQGSSRLDYTNTPNPYPNYWKYLPVINENPQINWLNLYETNLNTDNLSDRGAARYFVYENLKEDKTMTINSVFNTKINLHVNLDIGLTFKGFKSDNYATPKDLLGSSFYIDVNPFNLIDGKPVENDILGFNQKRIGDRIKYNFDLNANQLNAFTQLRFKTNNFDFFIAGNYTNTSYQRNGKFLNQSFENNSLGKSKKLTFTTFGFKGGINYSLSTLHQIQMNLAYLTKAPTLKNTFINSRENNALVPNLKPEIISSAEVNYLINYEKIKGRLSTYITEFKEGTTVNSFFAEIGSGADFFQEVVTNIDKRHLGVELGLEYKITPNFNTSAVISFGQHTYTNNATIGVNFDAAEFSQNQINTIGFENLGETAIKNYKVANGPQQAYSLGFEYKNLHHWSINASGNYFSNGYLAVSTISRTSSFFNNPNDFGQPFQNIDLDLARKLLKQEKFDPYFLVDLSARKSWWTKGTTIKIVASIHNLFDKTYKSGGHEQSRTANYGALVADTANGNLQRNFGPKYWYGFGRTYFINLAFSFKKMKSSKERLLKNNKY